MMVRRFARPYAKAIMDVTGSSEAAGAVRDDLEKFDAVRRGSAELREVLANPGIDLDAKLGIAKKIGDRVGLAAMTLKVIEVLVRNHRINDLEAIVEALTAYVNEATNTLIAEVRTAHALSENEAAELRKTLEKKFGKRVDVRLSQDKELLGGFVARVGSEIYDASVAGKIDKFRDSLS